MLIALLSIGAIFLILYYLVQWRYSYWTRRGVMQIAPKFPFGNIKDVVLKKTTLEEICIGPYKEMKKNNQKHGGIYAMLRPVWLVVDRDLVQTILIRDFQYFTDHTLFYHHELELLTNHLFNLEGEKWKRMRSNLTPTFSSGKIKGMLDIVASIGKLLEKKVEQYVNGNEPFLVRNVIACFSTDVISSCAFGLDTKTLDNPQAEFRVHGKKFFQSTQLKAFIEFFFSWDLLAYLGYRYFDQNSTKYIMNAIKNTIEFREKNNLRRNDFVHLLLQLKNKGKLVDDGDISKTGEGIISMDDVIANMFIFYLAGFETSSTATSFLMYEMARHQDLQDKLRDEFHTVLEKYGGKVTYEGLQEMKFADQCIEETLRMYAPVGALPRLCTKTYKVPDSNVVIDKGTTVIVPVYAIHHDPDFYPNPEEFDPDNFTKENKANRPSCTWLGFGEGPRQCIGLRFGYMQIKVAIISLLSDYRFTLNKKTPNKLTMDPIAVVTSAKEEIWLDVSRVR